MEVKNTVSLEEKYANKFAKSTTPLRESIDAFGIMRRKDLTKSVDESLDEKFSDSFPDWFKDRLGKESNYGTVASFLNAKNIDLNKASFVEKSVPQNIKDIHAITDNELPVFLLKDEWSEYLYIPGLNSNDYDVVYNAPDPSRPGFTKNIYARPSKVPYKYLLPMIEKFGYIDFDAPNAYTYAIRKERADAKAGSIERGRGQFQHHDQLGYEKDEKGRNNYNKPILDPKVQWLDTKGQDKSGYLIKPDAIKDRLLKMHEENPAYLLDKIYNRLVAARDRISKYFNSYDIKKGGDPRSGIIGSKLDDAVEYFTRASDKYRTIVEDIEDINNSKDPDDRKKQQIKWIFDPETSWSGGYIDLRDYVDSLEAALDKLETSKPNQYDEAFESKKTLGGTESLNEMIIDSILDRKDGEKYDPEEFYRYVRDEEEEALGSKDWPISRALDSGTEDDVKNALCKYIIDNEYNPKICDYVKSVNWLDEAFDAEEAPAEDDKIVPDDQDDEDDVPMTPKDYKMVYGDSYGDQAGQEVREGDTLTDFRGDKAIYCTFTDNDYDGTRVAVVNTPEEFKRWKAGDWQVARNYYWSVFNLKLQKR